jgi:hypothetical protein
VLPFSEVVSDDDLEAEILDHPVVFLGRLPLGGEVVAHEQ